MTEPLEQLKIVFQDRGQRLTAPRQLVFEALLDKEPQTMAEIVAACAGLADKASVYRSIALFERLGVVKRLPIGWKYKLELSDQFHRHHHHLTCLRCGRTFALPEDQALEAQLRALAAGQDFDIRDHEVEISGYCRDCRAARAADIA